jgi:hypothetical protein
MVDQIGVLRRIEKRLWMIKTFPILLIRRKSLEKKERPHPGRDASFHFSIGVIYEWLEGDLD